MPYLLHKAKTCWTKIQPFSFLMTFVQPGKKRDRFDRDCLLLEFIHSLPAFNFWLSEHKRRPNMDRDRVRESRERRVSEKKKKSPRFVPRAKVSHPIYMKKV